MSRKDQAEFEDLKELLEQFEDANSNSEIVRFNEEEFEEIIHYYLQNNEAQNALDASEMALKLFPYSSEFCLTKADAHIELGEVDEAEELLLNNFKIDKSDVDYYMILSEIYILRSEYDTAIEICEEGIQACEDGLDDLLLHLAEIYDHQGEYKMIVPLLEDALKINPNNEDAMYLFSITMTILDEVEHKIGFYQKMIDNDPFNVDAWYYLSSSYRELSMYEKAIECLEYIEAIDQDQMIMSEMAQTLMEAGMYEKAIVCLKEYEKTEDLTLPDLMSYAFCYKQLGDIQKSKSYYKEALSHDETNDEIYYQLALLFYEEEKYEASLVLVIKALEKNSDTAQYLELKADALIGLNRVEEACKIYLDIIQLNHSTPYYLSKFAYITAVELGMEEAIAVLDTGIDEYHQESLHYHKAVLYFHFEKEDLAYYEFAIGLERDFDSHHILFDKIPELKDNQRLQQMLSVYE